MQAEGEVGKVAKWVTHYCSDHKILLVGEGDFSFSLSLACSFGSASNIVASSLDSYAFMIKRFYLFMKYKHAKSNLDNLQKLGACFLHGVDATKMMLHPDFKMRRFDRIIFNFPHAGFHRKEGSPRMIKMPRALLRGFFKNASCLLRPNGEIHVNHKTTPPFSDWNIKDLAMKSSLTWIESVDFRKEDFPCYNNKRGDGSRCDQSFPLGKCSTFKFICDPRALGKCKMTSHMASEQQRDMLIKIENKIEMPFPEIQEAVQQPPPSIDINYHPQTGHISISGGYLNNAAILLLVLSILVAYGRVTRCASAPATSLVSQRPLQPMQSSQSLQPMKSLQSSQPN